MQQLETIQEDKTQIIRDGLSALASISESCHAVSTKNRFNTFCRNKNIEYLERGFNWRDLECGFEISNIQGKRSFKLIEEFRQTGYGAWHIGSRIEELKEKGKNVLVINGNRNRRFLLVEVQNAK